MDLRVLDAPRPVDELARLVAIQRATSTVLDMVNAEGFLAGPFQPPVDGTDAALAALARIAEQDWEPGVDARLWGTVLRARAGRPEQALAAAQDLVAQRPSMRQFLDNLVSAGFLERSPL